MTNREGVLTPKKAEGKGPEIVEINESLREIEISPKTLVMFVGLPGSGKSTFAYNISLLIQSSAQTDYAMN